MGWKRSIRLKLAQFFATYKMGPELPEGPEAVKDFMAYCKTMEKPRVLELGTKRSIADRSTLHKDMVPHAGEFLGTDYAAGDDVHIVADIHRLADVTGEEQFDVIISCSSFEHFKYPQLAAHNVMRALKVGGALFIQTHQTFPLHAYPYDYFRFSREALSALFGTKMGFTVLTTNFQYPARIYSREVPATPDHPAYLNVNLFGKKTGPTPKEYIYEYDV